MKFRLENKLRRNDFLQLLLDASVQEKYNIAHGITKANGKSPKALKKLQECNGHTVINEEKNYQEKLLSKVDTDANNRKVEPTESSSSDCKSNETIKIVLLLVQSKGWNISSNLRSHIKRVIVIILN